MAKKPFGCSAREVVGNAARNSVVVGTELEVSGNQFAVAILRIKLIAARATSLSAMIEA